MAPEAPDHSDPSHEIMDRLRQSPIEPHLRLVRSVMWSGHRVRAVFNRIYLRPRRETFHEFLDNVVIWTLGQTWFKHQISMKPDERHEVIKWRYAFYDLKKRTMNENQRVEGKQVWSSGGSGPVLALITLGYDLFCLQQKNALPDFLVDRLRSNKEFQSARYEIATAAIMARAAFEIEYLDDEVKNEKHCEFIARSVGSRIEIGVEAKSKVRPGVLHGKGEQIAEPNWRGVIDLIRKAKKQKPADLPFLIFVDLNLPSTSGLPPDRKPLLQEGLDHVSRAIGKAGPEAPDPFNILVLTNSPLHYGSPAGVAPPLESAYTISQYPEAHIAGVEVYSRIHEAIARYGLVPREV